MNINPNISYKAERYKRLFTALLGSSSDQRYQSCLEFANAEQPESSTERFYEWLLCRVFFLHDEEAQVIAEESEDHWHLALRVLDEVLAGQTRIYIQGTGLTYPILSRLAKVGMWPDSLKELRDSGRVFNAALHSNQSTGINTQAFLWAALNCSEMAAFVRDGQLPSWSPLDYNQTTIERYVSYDSRFGRGVPMVTGFLGTILPLLRLFAGRGVMPKNKRLFFLQLAKWMGSISEYPNWNSHAEYNWISEYLGFDNDGSGLDNDTLLTLSHAWPNTGETLAARKACWDPKKGSKEGLARWKERVLCLVPKPDYRDEAIRRYKASSCQVERLALISREHYRTKAATVDARDPLGCSSSKEEAFPDDGNYPNPRMSDLNDYLLSH